MERIFVDKFIELGFVLGGECLSALLLVFCYISILMLWRYFSIYGLYLYNIVAVIAANIQVFKTTPFVFSPEPVALGTLLFATTFLVSDILTEHKGLKVAQRGIKLSFLAQVFMSLLMIVTLAYPPQGVSDSEFSHHHATTVQLSLYTLFAPSIRVLAASLTSYFLSQWIGILIFKQLKNITHSKMLWLRINVSTLISGFIDNVLFSLLAWVVFNPHPVTMNTLIFTYILGTYVARVVVSITSTPIIYLTHKFYPKKDS